MIFSLSVYPNFGLNELMSLINKIETQYLKMVKNEIAQNNTKEILLLKDYFQFQNHMNFNGKTQHEQETMLLEEFKKSDFNKVKTDTGIKLKLFLNGQSTKLHIHIKGNLEHELLMSNILKDKNFNRISDMELPEKFLSYEIEPVNRVNEIFSPAQLTDFERLEYVITRLILEGNEMEDKSFMEKMSIKKNIKEELRNLTNPQMIELYKKVKQKLKIGESGSNHSLKVKTN